jgi:hypothetical protein
MTHQPLIDAVLSVAFHGGLGASDPDTGIALLAEAVGRPDPPAAWRDAIALAVHEGYLYDPVRLHQGALQCHWRLELTPKGVAAVRGQRKE